MSDPIFYDPRTHRLPVSFDRDPPKPMTAAKIARVGDVLDTVEKITTIWHPDRVDCEHSYRLALRDFVWHRLARFAKTKRVPSTRDGLRLRDEMLEAQGKLDVLEDLAAFGLCTMREVCDARAALALADSQFQIAQHKFRDAKTQDEADKRAGIVRHHPQRKPPVVHL
jgi:hypothetical protein